MGISSLAMRKPSLLIVSCLVSALLLLGGCSNSGSEQSPVFVGIVAGATASEVRLPVERWEEILPTLSEGSSVVAVSAEGEPAIVGSTVIADLRAHALDRADDLRAIRAEISAAVTDVVPASTEGSVWAALSRVAAERPADAECKMLVQASGLSTAPPLDLQEVGISSLAVEDVLEQAAMHMVLGDLSGCAIAWYGLGVTAGSQPSLDEPAMAKLRALATGLVEASGGSVVFLPAGRVLDPPTGLPKVSVVPVTPVELTPTAEQAAGKRSSPTAGEKSPCVTLDLLDASIGGFERDSAVLLDKDGAERQIASLASEIEDRCGDLVEIAVVATTSSAGSKAGRERVSNDRSRMVAELLADELGLPLDEIDHRGVGHCELDPGEVDIQCTPDRAASGDLVLTAAAENRRAVISVTGER